MKSDAAIGERTPTINRIFFGIITLVFISSMLKVVYAYSLGSDTPPFPFWIIFYGFPIIGFILTTINGDIRLRLHKVWTPVGLAMLAIALFYIIFADFKFSILHTLFVNSSESILYANALGLLLAFVDLKVLYKYAYFFAPTLIFTIIGVRHDDGYLLTQLASGWNGPIFEGDGFVDQFWFASGILFAYFAIKKFRNERPKPKKTLMFFGASVAIVIILIIAGNIASKFLPANSWVANWLSAQKPPVNLECIGSGCGLPSYSNIYSSDSPLCVKSNSSFRGGVQQFSIVAQDHALLMCKFLMDTDASTLTVACPQEIAPSLGSSLNFTLLPCGAMNGK